MSVEQNSYQSWVERVAGDREALPLNEGEKVMAPAAEPFAVVEMFRTTRPHYVGEVGKKSGDFVFHFFPRTEGQEFPSYFEDRMGDAFLEVFKFEDRVKASYIPELKSWAVVAQGFALNPMAEELAQRLFQTLDRTLG
jgi:hypothetical protein